MLFEKIEEYIKTHDKQIYTLDDVMAYQECLPANRKRKFDMIVRRASPEHIIESTPGRSGGTKCNLKLTKDGFKATIGYSIKQTQQTHGIIYGFWLKYVPNTFKVGRTCDWARRKKNYSGFNTPGEMIVVRSVGDMRKTEERLLKMLNAYPDVERTPFGNEWFTTTADQATIDDMIRAFLTS